MWVFDISDENTDNWGLATIDNKPLFTATSPTTTSDTYISQPITTRPSIGLHPSGNPEQNGVLVAFGTGKYVETGDNVSDNQATQSFYVIWDHYLENTSTSDQYNSVAISSVRDSSENDTYTDLLH